MSLVRRQMRHSVGIAGRIFDTLAKGGVNTEMISQGASRIDISSVVEVMGSAVKLDHVCSG